MGLTTNDPYKRELIKQHSLMLAAFPSLENKTDKNMK